MSDVKNTIAAGKAVLGIEFGSTRIKAVLIDENNAPIASGSHEWENQLVDNMGRTAGCICTDGSRCKEAV